MCVDVFIYDGELSLLFSFLLIFKRKGKLKVDRDEEFYVGCMYVCMYK